VEKDVLLEDTQDHVTVFLQKVLEHDQKRNQVISSLLNEEKNKILWLVH